MKTSWWQTGLIILTTSFGSNAIAANSTGVTYPADDIFVKCSTRINGRNVITADKWQAVADNLTDSAFAQFDSECKGRKGNPKAVEAALKSQQQANRRIVNDLRVRAEARKSVDVAAPMSLPADQLRRDFGQEKYPSLPFLFRDAYSTYSLLSAPPARERATGTQISYTKDYQSQNDIISGKGAIIGWNVLSIAADSENALASIGVTRMLWAPGVEFDQSRNRSNPKLNTDYLAFKFIGETEREVPGGLFPLQYLRYAGYWKTDSRGDSRIAGGYTEWEPYNLDLAIGVAPRLFGTPLQFRWSPIVHFEAEKVLDAGTLTNLHTGDLYVRGGPILRADIFFAEGFLSSLVLSAQYRYLWNTTNTGSAYDVKYFQADAAYNLDPAGNFALSATYRDGITPGNGTRVKDLKTGLTIKY